MTRQPKTKKSRGHGLRLAFDLGAETGRAIVGSSDRDRLRIEVKHPFLEPPNFHHFSVEADELLGSQVMLHFVQ